MSLNFDDATRWCLWRPLVRSKQRTIRWSACPVHAVGGTGIPAVGLPRCNLPHDRFCHPFRHAVEQERRASTDRCASPGYLEACSTKMMARSFLRWVSLSVGRIVSPHTSCRSYRRIGRDRSVLRLTDDGRISPSSADGRGRQYAPDFRPAVSGARVLGASNARSGWWRATVSAKHPRRKTRAVFGGMPPLTQIWPMAFAVQVEVPSVCHLYPFLPLKITGAFAAALAYPDGSGKSC